MSMPDEISYGALGQALEFLGFDDPGSIVEMHILDGRVSVVSLLTNTSRGGNPVYEASTYDLNR